jgi:PAS domain S-box-containing protein
MLHSRKAYIYFIALLLAFHCASLHAESTKPDSLRTALRSATADSTKVLILHQLYQETDSVSYAHEGFDIAEKTDYAKGAALMLMDIGRSAFFNGDPDIALGYLTKSVEIAEKKGEEKILISAYRYIGYIYRPDDPSFAEAYYNKSLKLAKKNNDEIAASYAYSALGNVYEKIFEGNTESNKTALQFYLKSLHIREKVGAYDEIASSLNETSRVYNLLGQNDTAMALRLKGLAIAEKVNSTENIIFLCNLLGNDYSFFKHDFKKGLEYHLRAYKSALTFKNNFDVRYDISKGVSYDYQMLGDLKKSNDFYQKTILYNDSQRALQAKHDYNLSGLKHNLEKQLEKQTLLLKDAQILKGNAEASRQTILLNAFIIGFLLILILFIVIYRWNMQEKRSNREQALKNKKIETAYQVLAASERKFKVITETINDIFYLYNIRDKKYEYISPNCVSLVGENQSWFYKGNSMNYFVLERDLPIVYKADTEVQTGKSYEIEYRIVVNGKVKWIAEKSSPTFDEKGSMAMHAGICRDITAKKAAEDKFKLITETINDVFYLYNIVEKKYEHISPNCYTLFGLDQDFFYSGKSMKTIVHEDDLALVIDANVRVDSGIEYDIEYRIIVNEQIKWVAEKSSPIFDEKNNLIRNSGICRDITQRKTDEAIIEMKNQDIKDSILYANTIQHAILAPKEEIAKKLKDFFILSKPKDIVSGDFYFYRETEKGLILALADCTGHGVPGGFMSMLGNAFLNEIVNKNEELIAAKTLDQLREMVIRLLNQTTSYTSNKDGMDIALLIIENDKTSLQYAGAHIPLHVLKNGELQTIMGDKLPIGINIGYNTANFTNHKISLQKGDSLYLLSDGYADQFGGKDGKKFSKSQLKDLLVSIQNKKMNEQEEILNQTFEEWKGDMIQIDDVMAIGIRV